MRVKGNYDKRIMVREMKINLFGRIEIDGRDVLCFYELCYIFVSWFIFFLYV